MQLKVNLSYTIFLRKIREAKLSKNISDFMNIKKDIFFYKMNIFFKNPWGSVFIKFPNFIQKGSMPILWLCSGKI